MEEFGHRCAGPTVQLSTKEFDSCDDVLAFGLGRNDLRLNCLRVSSLQLVYFTSCPVEAIPISSWTVKSRLIMDTEMLLTPPASAASPSPSTASGLTRASNNLPAQRRHPLIRGSAKEVHLIHYVDDALERVYRRYEKRLVEDQRSASTPSKHDDAPGYVDMSEVVADLDGLVDIVWISRTRKWHRNCR